MGLAIRNPFRIRRSFLIIREVLGQRFGIELQLAGGGLQGMFFRVLIEFSVARLFFAQSGSVGTTIVALFFPFLETDEFWHARMFETEFYPVLNALAAGIFFEQAQPLGDHADDLIVALGFSQRLNALSLHISEY